MGVFDAMETAIEGVLGALIVGAIWTGLWATLTTYYGNTEVFALGAVVLVILGIVPLAIVIATIKKIFQDTAKERQAISDFVRRD